MATGFSGGRANLPRGSERASVVFHPVTAGPPAAPDVVALALCRGALTVGGITFIPVSLAT